MTVMPAIIARSPNCGGASGVGPRGANGRQVVGSALSGALASSFSAPIGGSVGLTIVLPFTASFSRGRFYHTRKKPRQLTPVTHPPKLKGFANRNHRKPGNH